jgi:hypothetical protein
MTGTAESKIILEISHMKKENKKSKEEFVKLYVPELRQLVESGDEKMCLVMAQCEYWFGHKPDGFYKFMSPAKGDNPAYRQGDSWTEEMGMSSTKIANALKPICTHYPSFTAYKNEEVSRPQTLSHWDGKFLSRFAFQ